MPESIRIAPSVLSADFARLGEQVLEAVEGGADSIHLDVMDGHFVPNLTFGPPVIQALRTQTDAEFDVHMMVENPERYIPALAEASADLITVHVEAVRHLHRVVHQIKNAGHSRGRGAEPGHTGFGCRRDPARPRSGASDVGQSGFRGSVVHRVVRREDRARSSDAG